MNHRLKQWGVLLAFSVVVWGCAGGRLSEDEGFFARTGSGKAVPKPLLTREESILRAKQIADVSYTLWFDLDNDHTDYEGRVVINFEARNRPQDLKKGTFVDFDGGTIQSLKLNGTPLEVSAKRYSGSRIHFSGQEIQQGLNRLEISFAHSYQSSGPSAGLGLNRYVDEKDQSVYLFSNLNFHGASRIFPCFDQPDLRASFELTVQTPEGWTVVANTSERDVSKVGGRQSWVFPPSPKLSSSVFALFAGPFAHKDSEAEGVPLRIFYRKSLEQKVAQTKWFQLAASGIELFNEQLAYPFPYAKYDQIFVPLQDRPAFSNAGAVALSESLLDSPESFVVFHELAHMWFGNLTNPRWWNSLWFYQAMADLLAQLALEDKTIPLTQKDFSAQKQKAYDLDSKGTEQALEVLLPSKDSTQETAGRLEDVRAVPVLLQLRAFIGEDEFSDGIQRFLIKHALRNAGVAEFFKALGEASGRDLVAWRKAWLQTPGLNSMRVKWACEIKEDNRKRPVSRISAFTLIQGVAAGAPILRPHFTEIALYDFAGKAARIDSKYAGKGPGMPYDVLAVAYSGAETEVRAAIGKPCPDYIFANYNDQDYVRLEMEEADLMKTEDALRKIGEPETVNSILLALKNQSYGGYAELLNKGLRASRKGSETQKVYQRQLELLKTSGAAAPGNGPTP